MQLNKTEFKNYKNISIYGAGNWATRIYYYFQANKIQIKRFIVTELSENIKFLNGIPVVQFDKIKGDLQKDYVIIAMERDTAGDVKKILDTYEIKNEVINTSELSELINDFFWNEYKDVKIQSERIFVDCYEGDGYKCNCKYLINKLTEQRKDLDIVWNINQKNELSIFPEMIRTVRRYSQEYYKELYSSAVVIANDDMVSGIKKRKEQFFVNTWHGSGPFKRVNGGLALDDNERRYIRDTYARVDLFVSGSSDNTKMFRESFFYNGEILEAGNPRNDILLNDVIDKDNIRKKIGIDKNRKVLLYAPTFRDKGKISFEKYDLDMDKIIKALNKKFNESFVLLYRFHHRLYKFERCKEFYKQGINVTLYDDVQEILSITDVLISDYSSIIWDFSLMKKPIFLYQNDLDEYCNDRGFYCPVSEWPYINGQSTEELVDRIINFDEKKYQTNLKIFFDKYKSFDFGNAAEQVSERVLNHIQCGAHIDSDIFCQHGRKTLH